MNLFLAMSIFWLNETLEFPHPGYANSDGLLAVGGDLSVERLLVAYQQGIFPWYNEDDPILWWSPDPRYVVFPEDVKVSKSMKQVLRRGMFEVTFDQDFIAVMEGCRDARRNKQSGGTWVTEEFIEAYTELHHLGYAHSVEVWQEGKLVGGLYGVTLGKCFFGESMFSNVSNASKTGFITLAKKLQEKGFWLIDCQMRTDHLVSLGAVGIPRRKFLHILNKNNRMPTQRGEWQTWLNE